VCTQHTGAPALPAQSRGSPHSRNDEVMPHAAAAPHVAPPATSMQHPSPASQIAPRQPSAWLAFPPESSVRVAASPFDPASRPASMLATEPSVAAAPASTPSGREPPVTSLQPETSEQDQRPPADPSVRARRHVAMKVPSDGGRVKSRARARRGVPRTALRMRHVAFRRRARRRLPRLEPGSTPRAHVASAGDKRRLDEREQCLISKMETSLDLLPAPGSARTSRPS
jgi:hypothetical protein